MSKNMSNTRTLELTREPIELCNVLKLEGLVSSGGQAKLEIAAGQVKLNGLVETQKRKKVVSGDVVEYRDQIICLQLKA